MGRITPKEILNLIRRLPGTEDQIIESNEYHSEKSSVSTEWFAGTFAGRCFVDDTIEGAAQQLIDYMYRHVGHKSIVGHIVREIGFPDVEMMYERLTESE